MGNEGSRWWRLKHEGKLTRSQKQFLRTLGSDCSFSVFQFHLAFLRLSYWTDMYFLCSYMYM